LTLGEKIIDIFIEHGFLTDFVSFYHLREQSISILSLEGFKQKKLDNILESIEVSRNMSLASFFVALGIPQVGRKTGKLLAKYVSEKIGNRGQGTGDDILSPQILSNNESWKISETASEMTNILCDILFHLTYEELEAIHDVGPATAGSIVYYFEENREMLTKLLYEVHPTFIIGDRSQKKETGLSGKSFCVTGSFEGISREEIHTMIEENGGEVRTSISAKLDYLIVGSDAGSKKAKAEELDIEILTIEDLYVLIQG
jgi:DNA ligase (NAD+)